MTELATKSLAAKLAAVIEGTKNVEKSGYNQQFKYKYVPASDIYAAIRVQLAKVGVVILPNVLERSCDELTTKSGGANYRTVLKLEFTITDGNETFLVPWYAEALDLQDKGINKAVTNALKYFLIDLFLIPTGDEEPDATGEPEPSRPAAAAAAQPPRQQNAPVYAGWTSRADAVNWALEQTSADGKPLWNAPQHAANSFDKLKSEYHESLNPKFRPTKDSDQATKDRHMQAVFKHWYAKLSAYARGEDYALPPYERETRIGGKIGADDGADFSSLS